MAWLTRSQLEKLGFQSLGENIYISDKASIYNANKIILKNNIRIDDFCILSAGAGGIELGDYTHIAAYSSLIGSGKITMSDFSGISSRVSIYSSNDDYSGSFLTNPTIPKKYTNVRSADVFLAKHVIIGSGSVIMPGVILEEGAAVGALSLVSRNCSAYGIYAGQPAKKIKERNKEMIRIELELKNESNHL